MWENIDEGKSKLLSTHIKKEDISWYITLHQPPHSTTKNPWDVCSQGHWLGPQTAWPTGCPAIAPTGAPLLRQVVDELSQVSWGRFNLNHVQKKMLENKHKTNDNKILTNMCESIVIHQETKRSTMDVSGWNHPKHRTQSKTRGQGKHGRQGQWDSNGPHKMNWSFPKSWLQLPKFTSPTPGFQ